MRNVIADQDVSLVVPFMVDGEFVTPDTGSVVYSVRNGQGTLIGALTNVTATVAAGATQTIITIAAAHNSKTLDYETRSVMISFKKNGNTFTLVEAYRINAWINILGLNEFELPDHDIDLIDAYYTLTDALGDTSLADALVSGTTKAKYANRAVAIQAAIAQCTSIPMRAMRSEKSGDTSYDRYPRRDWSMLERDLSSDLEQALDLIITGVKSVPTNFILGTRTDRVTGA